MEHCDSFVRFFVYVFLVRHVSILSSVICEQFSVRVRVAHRFVVCTSRSFLWL